MFSFLTLQITQQFSYKIFCRSFMVPFIYISSPASNAIWLAHSEHAPASNTVLSLFPPGFQAHFQGGVRRSPGTGLLNLEISYEKDVICFIPARTCDALVMKPGTNVSPSSCLNNQNSIGDVCTFSCQAGYEFNSDTKVLVCEPSGNWNGSVVHCQSK